MILFWSLASAMVGIAIAIGWIALHQHRSTGVAVDIVTESQALAGFQQRLAELERDYQAGHIDRTLYESLRTELERQLLADTDRTSSDPRSNPASLASPPTSAARFAQVATVAAVSIPLGALLYYVTLYQGETHQWIAIQQRLDPQVTQALAQSDALPLDAMEDLPDFTRVLQRRLAQQGLQDADGLYLLGRCYLALQQPQAARLALARAHQQDAQRLDIMLAYAQALILTDEGRLNATSAALLHTVLQQQPQNERALLLLGLGAFQSGAYSQAIQAWQTLLALRPTEGEGTQLLRRSIARAQAALAALQPADPTSESHTDPPPTDHKQADNGLREKDRVTESGDTVTGPQLAVTVHLDPKLQSQLADYRTLFIYAKAVHGPPMPLAAIRQPVETFPVQVVLDESQAMMPTFTLSSVGEVIVGARLSKAGEAQAQPGDWQGLSAPIALAAGLQTVTLTIDQPVQ